MPNTWDLPTEGCENTMVAPEVPCATHNLCVLGVDQRMYRIAQELTRNVSSRATGISANDKERIDSYYDELVSFINLTAANMADLHYLAQFKLTDLLATSLRSENEALHSALQYLVGGNINLRTSQSSRLNDGLIAPDLQDLLEVVAKSKAVIDTFFDNFNPLDMPQSAPQTPVNMPTGA